MFFEDPVADMAFQLVGIAIGIPVVLWGARYLGRRPAGTVSSVLGRLRWKWLGLCAAVAVPMIIVQFGIMIAWTWGEESAEPAGDGFPGWTAFLVSLAVLGALVPFQAAAEEYVFRGWLVQVIGRAVRSPWPAVVIASLLFALAHGFGELSGFVLLFYSALWWGWLVIRTGGLEAVITMHAANNLLAFGLAAGFGELASTETAADAPWQAMAVEFVFAPLYCLVMARIADRRGWRGSALGRGLVLELGRSSRLGLRLRLRLGLGLRLRTRPLGGPCLGLRLLLRTGRSPCPRPSPGRSVHLGRGQGPRLSPVRSLRPVLASSPSPYRARAGPPVPRPPPLTARRVPSGAGGRGGDRVQAGSYGSRCGQNRTVNCACTCARSTPAMSVVQSLISHWIWRPSISAMNCWAAAAGSKPSRSSPVSRAWA